MSSGSLSLRVKSDTRIDCSYSYSGIASDRKFCLYMKKTGSPSTPPTIFYPPPSGSGTKSFTGLKPSTNYTFYCYDYKNSTTYTELDRKSATTKSTPPPPPPEPKGTLTASTKSHTEITLNYSYSDGKNVSLFRGSTLIKTFGSGSSSGVYNDSGLTPETSYTYYLRNGTLASSTLLAQATAKTFPEPIGNLSLVKANPYSVKLAYSYEHGTNVSLFNGDELIITFGSGTGEGEYTVENLLSRAEYTFYLRNGTTSESELLGEVTVHTPSPAEGTLSAVAVDSATIDLIYSFTSGDNVSLFRDGSRIKTFGSGDGSGAYRDTGLSPDTQYNYYLRNGFNETDLLLATASAKTLKEARKAVIEQGKILPLSSKITIFDTSLTRIGIIEDYEYLRWNFRYRTIDDFELKINRYKPNTEYLIKNNILSLYVAGYHRAAMIESIELSLTQEGKISEVYTIRGRGLDNLLAERIALHNTASGTGYDSQNTYAETAMRHYVNVNCMDATDTDRNYSFLYLADDLERGGNIKYDARFQTIAEILEEISLISGLGWSVVLDPTNKRLVFQVLEGLDRSFGNGENSTVMFSPKFGNIQLISYRNSSVGSKNVNYTAGQGEAQERTVVKVTKDDETYTGLSRREILTDARDLDTADKLTQRGQGRLAELGEEIMLEMENLQTGPFKFGEDFDLGDIVTIEYPDIISADVRVLESQIEISADKGIQNKLILGREFPDLINIRKIENKNIAPEIRR